MTVADSTCHLGNYCVAARSLRNEKYEDMTVDTLRSFFRAIVAKLGSPFFEECILFALKQAWACLFGGLLLAAILVTHFWYPLESIHRYDFLFIYAVSIQILLILCRLESIRELGVIAVFHILATGMELFKTHDAIASWSYPGEAIMRIGNVPLFTGFMYSAVGSYMARVWRGFELKFTHFPPLWLAVTLAALSYINFFTHRYTVDIRWGLIGAIGLIYWKTHVHFRPDQTHRKMPLLLGFIAVAFFIWIAENLGTYARAWVYPCQTETWRPIGPEKWTAWFLLMQLSFVLIVALRRLEARIARTN